MYDDNDDDDILIIDEDDIRNGSVVVRRGGGRADQRSGSSVGRRSASPSRSRYPTVVRQPAAVAQPIAQPTTTTVIETQSSSTKRLSDWVPDVLRGLAAIMPMPAPPSADDDVGDNVKNLITYFGALSQTAQRKEQLHTLAAIAARHL